MLLVFVATNATVPLYILWQRQMGFPTSGISYIFICYKLGVLLSLLIAGRLSDIHGRRAVLVPALFVAIAACVCFAFAQNMLWLAAGRLLIGFASGAFASAGTAAVIEAGVRRGYRFAPLVSQLLGLLAVVLVVCAEYQASISLLLAAALSAGFAQSLSQFAGITLIKQYAPPDELAGVTGTFFFGGYITAGLTVGIMGFAANTWGLQIGSELFVVLCMLVMFAALAGTLKVMGKSLPA